MESMSMIKKKTIVIILLMAFFNVFTMPVHALSVNAGRKIPVVYDGQKVTGKQVSSGDKIYGKVQSDVVVSGKTVFKEGATVTLNVADAKKARCWGNPGEMLLINGTAEDINGTARPIEYNYKIVGNEKTWPKVLGCVSIFFLFPLALFGFVHGGQAELIPNKVINTTLLNDFTI